ncbi:hypothetical protein HZB01_00515 [Candidatus Woesearchaeota archaeon]|nr:hypothetical protein [Candidatus Woesearchaeota archaeon]
MPEDLLLMQGGCKRAMEKLINYLRFFTRYEGKSLFTFTLCNRIVGYSAELYCLMEELNRLMKERQKYLDSLKPKDKKKIEANITKSLEVFKKALKDLVKIMIDADTLIYENVMDFEETLKKTKGKITRELSRNKQEFVKKEKEWRALVRKIEEEKKSIHAALEEMKRLERKKVELEKEEKVLKKKILKEEEELVYLEKLASAIHQDISRFIKKLDLEVKDGLDELIDVSDIWKEWAVSGSVDLEGIIKEDAIEIAAMEDKIKKLKESLSYTSLKADEFEREFKTMAGVYEKELAVEENIEALDNALLRTLLKHIDDIIDSTTPLENRHIKSSIGKTQKELEKELRFLRNLVENEEVGVDKRIGR